MNSSAPYSEIILSGNIIVRFFDHSSIYYGDYHHVRLQARCEFELPDCQKARSVAPSSAETSQDPAVYTRTLERMAVPSSFVEDVKGALIEDFIKNTLPYLSSPDFPVKLISRKAPGKSITNMSLQRVHEIDACHKH